MLKNAIPNQIRKYSQKFDQFDINAVLSEKNLQLQITDHKENAMYSKELNNADKKQLHPKVDIEDIFLSLSCTRIPIENNEQSMQDIMTTWLNCFFAYHGKGKINFQSKMLDMRTNKFVCYESCLQLDKKQSNSQVQQIPIQNPVEKSTNEQIGLKKVQLQVKMNESSYSISNLQTYMPTSNQISSQQLTIFQKEEKHQENILTGISFNTQAKQVEKDQSKNQPIITQDQQYCKPSMQNYEQFKFQEDLRHQMYSSNFENRNEKQSTDNIIDPIQKKGLKKKQKRRKFSQFVGKKQEQNIEDIISKISLKFSNDQGLTQQFFQNLQNLSPQQQILKIKEIYGQDILNKIKQQNEEEIKNKKMTYQSKRKKIQQLFDNYYVIPQNQVVSDDQNQSEQQLDYKQLDQYEKKYQELYDVITPDFLKQMKYQMQERKKRIQLYYKSKQYQTYKEYSQYPFEVNQITLINLEYRETPTDIYFLKKYRNKFTEAKILKYKNYPD